MFSLAGARFTSEVLTSNKWSQPSSLLPALADLIRHLGLFVILRELTFILFIRSLKCDFTYLTDENNQLLFMRQLLKTDFIYLID
jgi:hypothetical protein